MNGHIKYKNKKLKKDMEDTEQSSNENNDIENNKETLIQNTKPENLEEIIALKDVLVNSIPATMGLLFIFFAETINIIFIGNLNDYTLISAIGIGTLYVNATGYIIGLGLIGAIDTLCSQGFGAKEYKLIGIYVNIGRIVSIIFFTFLCLPCLFFCDTLLLYIGQSQEVADIASGFCYSMIPSLFFAMQYNCSIRYLQAMQIFLPGMVITLITAIFHSLWCYIFINLLSLKLVGAGFAIGITQLLNFIFVTLYIEIKNPNPESHFYFPAESFDIILIMEYLKLAIPSTVLFAADWLGFEVTTFMSSFLGNVSLAANVVLFNFITLIFMIPLGISFAVTALVGNSIGSRQTTNAKRYAITGILTAVSIVGVITILILIFKSSIPYVYTSEEKVVELVIQLLDIYICFSVIDSIQIVEHGILKGIGKQKIGSIVCLIILYPVNIPMAYFLGFVLEFGVVGFWYSQLITVILLATSYFLIIITSDWDDITDKCSEKFRLDNLEIDKKKVQ